MLVFPPPWAYAHGYTPQPLRGKKEKENPD